MTGNSENQDNSAAAKTIKVYATFKRLNYKGEVLTDVQERDIPWQNYDPEKFIKEVCLSGNVENFPKPFDGYFNDLMAKYFDIKEHSKIWRPFSVETEVVSGCKFVFQRHDSGYQVMKWENV